MIRNATTSDFKYIIFNEFDYAFIHELYDRWKARTLWVNVEYVMVIGSLPFLNVELKMFDDDGIRINKVVEDAVSVTKYPHMGYQQKVQGTTCLSIKKLLQQRSKFKNDTHLNKPVEIKMNQGVTRRIQASTNSEGNVQFKKPDNIRITNKIEVSEGQTTLRMNKGESQLAVIDTHAGKTIVLSFDLLETFYHAVKPD